MLTIIFLITVSSGCNYEAVYQVVRMEEECGECSFLSVQLDISLSPIVTEHIETKNLNIPSSEPVVVTFELASLLQLVTCLL